MAEELSCKDDLFCGVNVPEDWSVMTDLERKHAPVITAPDTVKKGQCFEVTVEVGKLLAHPNEPGHFIQFVELYADHTYLARADFTAVKTCPKATFSVALDHVHKELRAYERCNLHGVWLAAKAITVK
jgi:superoxide reductase